MSILAKRYFYDEAEAFKKLESVIWPDGPVCPKCGHSERIYELKGVRSKPSKKNPEGVERHGLKKCGKCRKQFTARVGTVFESSHVPLHKWLQAVFLMCSSKKGISSHQLHRTLEVKYQTAWFMTHRIREAMRGGNLLTPMGGAGKVVEIDETMQGRLAESPKKLGRGYAFRNIVLTLVERGGEARSFKVDSTSIADLMPVIKANVSRESRIMTDSASWYKNMNKDGEWAGHDAVDHSGGEYVRHQLGDITVHSNTVEGYYSIFKRGMKGVYQHCKERHLHRYLAEFDFRYSNRVARGIDDDQRTALALTGAVGKRLKYRDSSGVDA